MPAVLPESQLGFVAVFLRFWVPRSVSGGARRHLFWPCLAPETNRKPPKTARKPPETTTQFLTAVLAVFWRFWGPLSASGGAWRHLFWPCLAPETIRKPPENRQKTARNYHPISNAFSGGFLAVLGSPFRLRRRPEAPRLALSGARDHQKTAQNCGTIARLISNSFAAPPICHLLQFHYQI